MKKAILFGASGFIGSYLLDELLNDADYEEVSIVVRKDMNINHPKLTTLIGDYHSLPGLSADIVADEVHITLGTTKKKTPNKDKYYQVDHDYPVLAARIARERGARSVFVVSAVGANAHSSVFYIRTKGEMERDILSLDFEHTHIFRPSMLMGNRKENRPLERIVMKIWKVIDPVFTGKLSKYRGIDGKDVARAMNNAAKDQREKVKIYHWKEMNDLLYEKKNI
jgi:uncharacterized protein YbjT (DUF2867 family)